MKCLSCRAGITSIQTKMFAGKLFLCAGCNALAEKADAELVQANARALEQSRQWLEQHIMSGGLLKGGTGEGKT